MIQDDTLKCHLMELMQLVLFWQALVIMFGGIKISSMPFYHVITFLGREDINFARGK